MQYDGETLSDKIQTPGRILFVCALLGFVSAACRAQGSVETGSVETPDSSVTGILPITLVEPGTRVLNAESDAIWNRPILIASPKINSGDVDAVSETIRDAATMCSLTIMANVAKADRRNPDDRGHYELKKIGVGYSVEGNAGRVVISSDKNSEYGVSLGFIARQVLRTNEKQLAKVSVVAQTPKLVVFDAPSVMHRNGAHRKYVTRHLVYVDAETGEGATMSWLLVPPSDDEHPMAIINHPIRVTKWGTHEIRKIHVDANEFNFLGVPGELAFALEDLPPGADVAWTKRAAGIGAKSSYTAEELDELSDAMNQAMSLVE